MQRSDKALRFRDMDTGRPRLPKAGTRIFFAPHTSESAATLPLISDLSDMLGRGGVTCEAHAVIDMKTELLSISAKLARVGFGRIERPALEAMFRLKDAELRLGIVTRLLASEPSAVLLEVHALDKDYRLGDPFGYCPRFYRLPETRAVFLKDHLLEYSAPVEHGLEMIEGRLGKRLRTAAGIIGLDRGLRGMLERSLGFLEQNLDRTALIEIPAPCEDNGIGLGMTGFERAYGYSSSLMHTLTRQEVWKIAEALSA